MKNLCWCKDFFTRVRTCTRISMAIVQKIILYVYIDEYVQKEFHENEKRSNLKT